MYKVYYHSGCPDGIMSRELFKHSGNEAIFIPYLFEDNLPIEKDVVFVDCSPQENQREAFIMAGATIVDHHASFIEWLDAHPELPRDFISLGDTAKGESGAVLCWRLFSGREEWRELAEMIGASDCFIEDHPKFIEARAIAGMIAFFGDNWKLEDYKPELTQMFIEQKKKEIAILRKKAIHQDGYVFMNSTKMSDAAHQELKAGAKMVVGFEISDRGVQFSLRGPGSKEIAVKNGGGGHDVAAGFTTQSRLHPIELFFTVM